MVVAEVPLVSEHYEPYVTWFISQYNECLPLVEVFFVNKKALYSD